MKGRTCMAAFAAISISIILPAARAQTPAKPDPYRALFPDTSIVSFQYLLNAPAGKHGFLSTDNKGHFVWPDGVRAKFWGVNISNRSVFIKKEEIDRVVEVLARAGTNMVRFEALDSTGALVDIPGGHSSRVMNQEQLATLDYWIAKLRERGIYYYLDLLDFRQFKEGDGVPGFDQIGRAAKPYAFFDRRLIDLQKEYAQQLLLHQNPLTGLKYVDDPALALVEICNEHGLFFKAANLENLVEPYGAVLRQQWNRWLSKQYGSRDALKNAWGNGENGPVLSDGEDPASSTVALPLFTPAAAANSTANSPGTQDGRRMPLRVADGVRFLYDAQTAYFREIKSFLREIGVKVPITGVVSNDLVPDVASAAAELDFTSENYYADHPTFAGKDWEGNFFYNDMNPLRNATTYQIAPWLAGLRWENKPVVVREWAVVWPNRFRAIAIPEMASYASMQDFDAVLLFGYQISRDPEMLSDFDHQSDPLVWGLYGLGAQMFLRGDVRKSPSSATIAYSPDTLFRWPNTIGNLHRLAWFVRLNSTLSPAASAKGSQAEVHKSESQDLPVRTRIASRTIPRLQLAPRQPPPKPALNLVVPAGNPDALPGLLDQFGQAGASVSSSMLGTGVFVSSAHEIVRRTLEGILTVSTPRSMAICGEFPSTKAVEIGGWSLTTQTGIGALMAVSLDGRPLSESRKYIVKMVSRAENTGQELENAPPNAPGRMHLKNWGKAPVLTFGRACELPTKLKKGNQELLSLYLIDGTWELIVENGRARLACDTPGIRGAVFGKPVSTVGGGVVTVAIPMHPAEAFAPVKRSYIGKLERNSRPQHGKQARRGRRSRTNSDEDAPRRRIGHKRRRSE